jgi:hypothetical protein
MATAKYEVIRSSHVRTFEMTAIGATASIRAKRRVSAPQRSHPAISTASCGRDASLPLPTVPERAILRPTTTGNPGNVG